MSSPNPIVCAVMLMDGREQMVKQAIRAFEKQTYQEARLLIYDSGLEPEFKELDFPLPDRVEYYCDPGSNGLTIGEIRNKANSQTIADIANSQTIADIIVHWDSDDWSHPLRIEEQVQFLVEHPAVQCTGYREMLFWRECEPPRYGAISEFEPSRAGQAWCYWNGSNKYAVGTSLAYWRRAWADNPFLPLPLRSGGTGEDTKFLKSLRVESVRPFASQSGPDEWPRMIARIHGANTQYYGEDLLTASSSWSRAENWDAYCAKVMGNGVSQ